MLNYRATSYLFLISTLAIAVLFCVFKFSLMWGLLPFAFYVVMIVTGSANIRSGFFVKAYCQGETTEKKIALSFDDGPHPQITPSVLDILKKEQVTATFFVIGQNIHHHESILKRISEEGHLIGNH